eukprot:TRINITY_DN51_c0_g1_i4.p1 TRINITY_DN51_c0_g1~~TRINITY_DN51_c0_g1_i4.p1  ORF type:complete len:472 (+),score=56.84 TRINITY_DN51_c0_g1_i4:77-1417(+)
MKRTATECELTCDRFIPSRCGMDMDVANYNLTACAKENQLPGTTSEADLAASLSDSLFESKQAYKVLAFKNKAPAPCESYTNRLKVLYSQNGSNIKSKVKVSRTIASEPERVLDAPGILDDYYVNLLDWGANNQLAVCLGSTVYLWNATTSDITELTTLPSVGNVEPYISSVSWSQDGSYLAIGTAETNEVQLWDVTRQKQVRTLRGHSGRVTSLAWNQHMLSSGSMDTSIFNHDVRIASHHISTLSGHTDEVCGLKWSPDGLQLASGGNDNILNVWDAGRETPRYTLTDHQAAVKAIAWCPFQARTLASGGGTADRCIKLWNTETGALLQSVDTGSQVCALQWSRHYKELMSSHGYAQNQLTVWRYPSMEKVKELRGHSSRVLFLAASPDGETVVSGAGDERLRFWKVWPKPATKKVSTAAAGAAVAKKDNTSAIRASKRAVNIR